MAERTFAITSASPRISVDSSGGGQARFTVTNTTSRAMRCQVVPRSLGDLKSDWLSIAGEAERNLAPKETSQFIVMITMPSEVRTGSFRFRLDACSTQNPDEDYTEGPVVAVDMASAATPPPPLKRKFPWWIVLAIIMIAGAVALTIALRKEPPSFFLIGEPENVSRAAKLLSDLGLKKILMADETGMRLPGRDRLMLPEPDQVALYVVSAVGEPRLQMNAAVGSIHVLHKARAAVLILNSSTWSDEQRIETTKELGVTLVHLFPNDPRTRSITFIVDNDSALKKKLLSL
jgi:hypothetical protein